MKVSEVAGERVDNKAKLEVIRQEEQAIKQEHEEIAKSEEEDEKKKAIKVGEFFCLHKKIHSLFSYATSMSLNDKSILQTFVCKFRL